MLVLHIANTHNFIFPWQIFCAKCESTELPADNDIILCDGACERGFHQLCLEPPLLKDDSMSKPTPNSSSQLAFLFFLEFVVSCSCFYLFFFTLIISFSLSVPPDDEGWLCPGCDCKVDCIELLNDSQGTNLSILDTWEVD